MSEIFRKVTPYEYNYLCDKCESGMMKIVGEKDADGLYPHKCVICSDKASLKKSYPRIEYFGEDETPST